jgi:hypothetical protein
VERGSSFFLAVVLHGKRAGAVPNRMQRVIEDIERGYHEALREWDGDFEKVRGIKDSTEKLMKGPSILPQRKENGGKGEKQP